MTPATRPKEDIVEILVLWLICAVVTAVIANSKGRSGAGWFCVGLLIGIFGIVLAACLPAIDQRPEEGQHHEA